MREDRPDILAGLSPNYFGVILADPPWRFRTWDKATTVKSRDSDDIHYKTMTVDEIAALPVADYAAKDCCLFLWVCWPTLLDAMKVVGAWGFTYKTCAFAWVKANTGQIDMFRDDGDPLAGMGYWTRSNSEPCILATRGKPKRLSRSVRQGIIEPRRQHSRKPDCVHHRIEMLVAGPYLELFGRRQRHGWTVSGDEIGKFK